MNIDNKNALIQLYKKKSQNFHKILKPQNLRIKKSFLPTKSKFSVTYNTSSINQDIDDKSHENSKICFCETNDSPIQLILPSISNTSPQNKIILNSSIINNFNNQAIVKPRKKYTVKLKKIKIKKHNDKDTITPNNKNKKLLDLYKEDFQLKQRFERYKEKRAENMANFSYEKYNLNLLKLSSINLSQDSYNSFKKNMQTIESNMNGQRIKRKNRWLLFLEKIGNFAPEGLKRKIKSLSEHKKLEDIEN